MCPLCDGCSYIKRYMGAPAGVDIENLRSELEELRAENQRLKATIAELTKQVRRSPLS